METCKATFSVGFSTVSRTILLHLETLLNLACKEGKKGMGVRRAITLGFDRFVLFFCLFYFVFFKLFLLRYLGGGESWFCVLLF